MTAETNNPLQKVSCSSHLVSLTLFIDFLIQYQVHLSHLLGQIDALAEEVEAYQIIPGEIQRFNHAKSLVAFASVYSSGKFTATANRITKRGSKKMRHALYLAVLCSLKKTKARSYVFL